MNRLKNFFLAWGLFCTIYACNASLDNKITENNNDARPCCDYYNRDISNKCIPSYGHILPDFCIICLKKYINQCIEHTNKNNNNDNQEKSNKLYFSFFI
jgi:hypothetical protein